MMAKEVALQFRACNSESEKGLVSPPSKLRVMARSQVFFLRSGVI